MNNKSIKIAVLLTCHNRREKTLECLRALYQSLAYYDRTHTNAIDLVIYLTDDGCTDGTSSAIKQEFSGKPIHILQGSGNLYWAGGMRLAWNEALKRRDEWDFYLLLNDDTTLMQHALSELMSTHEYSIKIYGKDGLYSGVTCSNSDQNTITYGGNVWTNRFLGLSQRVVNEAKPRSCDFTNANILLVAKVVVDKIGIFYRGYTHGCADYDYSIQASKKQIPVLLTSRVCGKCDDDHDSVEVVKQQILSMNLRERMKYFKHPLRSNKDYLKFILRNTPSRYPFVWFGRFLNVYCPSLYYKLDKVR